MVTCGSSWLHNTGNHHLSVLYVVTIRQDSELDSFSLLRLLYYHFTQRWLVVCYVNLGVKWVNSAVNYYITFWISNQWLCAVQACADPGKIRICLNTSQASFFTALSSVLKMGFCMGSYKNMADISSCSWLWQSKRHFTKYTQIGRVKK